MKRQRFMTREQGPADGHWSGFARILSIALATAALVALPAPMAAQADPAEPTLTPELATSTFDTVWTRIAETHWDPEIGGVDWDAVREELRPRAASAESMGELRSILREALSRLGDSHFAILEGAVLTGGSEPEGGDADPGIALRLVEGRVLVSRVRADSPADQAGIGLGWELVRVGESGAQALRDEIHESLAGREDREQLLHFYVPSALGNRLQGPRDSEVHVEFVDASGGTVTASLQREEPGGSMVAFGNLGSMRVEVSSEEISTADGTVGLIRLSSWFPIVVPPIAEAVDRYRDASGLIFDLRGNPGGVGGLVMGIAGHVLDERVALGEMTTRDNTLRFTVNPQRIGPDGSRVTPYAGPVAILVDGLSASTSEIFAGGLQALGRARIFGEATPGQALPSVIVPLPNGDRLMHAIADYTAPDGTRLEGRGVRPDEPTPLTRAALLEGRDPALDAALRWIESSPRTTSGDAPSEPLRR